jgi:DNA-binding NarL/FixJ family response regulator
MSIRVLLVDDHPVVLDGVASALARSSDITVVAKARSKAEAQAFLAHGRADVALVDIRLPDGSGLDLVEEAGRQEGGPAWIVLSSFEVSTYVANAIHLGAVGYIPKTAPIEHIEEAIRRAAAGGVAYTARQLALARRAERLSMSGREREVLRLVAAGRTNDEIGRELGLARKTVEAYVAKLFERFEVSSRTELAMRASEAGLLG